MPSWLQIVVSSAAVSALVSLAGNFLLAMWTARSHKLRRYEDELISNRVGRCNELLQQVNELCDHLSPVAKGTRTLEHRGSGIGTADDSYEKEETDRTLELRRSLYKFIESNALYLGREVCLTGIYFDVGFDQLSHRLSMAGDKPSHAFYALCRWTWRFEDGIKAAIRRSLRDATFSPPSSLEIGAARTKGYQAMDELIAAIEKDPKSYSMDARIRELRGHTDQLSLPS